MSCRQESIDAYLKAQKAQLEVERQQLQASRKQLEADTLVQQLQLQNAFSELAADRTALMQLAASLMQSYVSGSKILWFLITLQISMLMQPWDSDIQIGLQMYVSNIHADNVSIFQPAMSLPL